MTSRRSKCKRGKRSVRSRSKLGKSFTACRTTRPHISSKGWKKHYPHKGAERHLIYKYCGSKCFGVPSKQLFPICAAHRSRSGHVSCKISSKGTSAAYNRALQLRRKYPRLASKIRSIARSKGFHWTRSRT
jgi:hypothetical protein